MSRNLSHPPLCGIRGYQSTPTKLPKSGGHRVDPDLRRDENEKQYYQILEKVMIVFTALYFTCPLRLIPTEGCNG